MAEDIARRTLPAPKQLTLPTTGIWEFTQDELDILGLRQGDTLGRGVVGPPVTKPPPPRLITPDQVRRLRECAFDEDITEVLSHAQWSEDSGFDALAQCMADIRSILEESIRPTDA